MGKTTLHSTTDSVIHLLHRVGQVSEDMFTRLAGADGLTTRQLVVLEIIQRTDKPSQTMVCNESGIDRSTLADIVRRLVSRGLVQRRRSREDARRNVLRLTEDGKQALNQHLPILASVETRALAQFDNAEREAMRSMLNRIIHGGTN